MRLRLPMVQFETTGPGFAPRPSSLAGLRVGFLDGWGEHRPDGTVTMYPTMVEIERVLRDRYAIGSSHWIVKPKISEPVPDEMLREFAMQVDVVINGEGL